MQTRLLRNAVMVGVIVSMLWWQGCRRQADDEGVGTSSVGAGGANGTAPNSNQRAEPLQGTGTAESGEAVARGERADRNDATSSGTTAANATPGPAGATGTEPGVNSAGQPSDATGGTTERYSEIERSSDTEKQKSEPAAE